MTDVAIPATTARELAAPRRAPPGRCTGMSTSFGTFGELMQGVLPGHRGDVLVTLPVAQWSAATFELHPHSEGLAVHPAHKLKALRMARLALTALTGSRGERYGGVLTLDGTLPEGKGMASSSADLVATARAVANALGREFPAAQIESLARVIEPTDGVMHPGIVAFDHRRVCLRARLGRLPALTIVGLDEGGVVDTVAFNRRAKPFTAGDRARYADLLHAMGCAVARQDVRRVGALATASAQMNQQLCPKRALDDVRRICRDIGGLGVVAAHSGTMLGILLSPDDPDYRRRMADGVRACAGLAGTVSLFRSLSFG